MFTKKPDLRFDVNPINFNGLTFGPEEALFYISDRAAAVTNALEMVPDYVTQLVLRRRYEKHGLLGHRTNA